MYIQMTHTSLGVTSISWQLQVEVRDYPERDIWSLGVMVQGSGQMGELLGRRRRRRRRRHLGIQA